MKIKIQKNKNAKMPEYANPTDAGMDLFSIEETILKSGEKKIVGTGIKMAIPEKYVGLIWDKSGLAAKNGIHVFAGVVDSGYRGEIKVVLKNFGEKDFKIEKHSKIAQILIQPIINAQITEVDSLEETNRGERGFGSTGLK